MSPAFNLLGLGPGRRLTTRSLATCKLRGALMDQNNQPKEIDSLIVAHENRLTGQAPSRPLDRLPMTLLVAAVPRIVLSNANFHD